MLKNLSFLALAGALTLSFTGCIIATDDTSDDEAGDGDGDTGDGDGDGDDEVGDGDGDPGDGDGDPGDGDGDPGDGDGDPGDGDGDPGDGDGDPGASCGWVGDAPQPGYYCGGEGEDPSGTTPYACPDGLAADAACDSVEPALTGIGCCDAEGNNWYCGLDDEGNEFVVMEACG